MPHNKVCMNLFFPPDAGIHYNLEDPALGWIWRHSPLLPIGVSRAQNSY